MTSDERDAAPGRRMAIITFAVAFIAAAATGFMTGSFRSSSVEQPIAFNHRKHVVENELECSTCHQFYETQTFSGMPDAGVCATCHQEPLGKSEEEAKLVRLLRTGQPLVWNSLFRQPSHVFYSHRRHVVNAQIKCEQCHGDIAETTSPPRQVRRLRMVDCITCHEQRQVAVDCTTCHR